MEEEREESECTGDEGPDAGGTKDINYRKILLQKQATARDEQRRGRSKDRQKSKRKRSRRDTHLREEPPPKPKKQRTDDDVTSKTKTPETGTSVDDDDEEDEPSADDQETAVLESMIKKKREEKKEKKELASTYARAGLQKVGNLFDREMGYPGDFGDSLIQDPMAQQLLDFELRKQETVDGVFEFASSYGLWTYIILKYLNDREDSLSFVKSAFSSGQPSSATNNANQ